MNTQSIPRPTELDRVTASRDRIASAYLRGKLSRKRYITLTGFHARKIERLQGRKNAR